MEEASERWVIDALAHEDDAARQLGRATLASQEAVAVSGAGARDAEFARAAAGDDRARGGVGVVEGGESGVGGDVAVEVGELQSDARLVMDGGEVSVDALDVAGSGEANGGPGGVVAVVCVSTSTAMSSDAEATSTCLTLPPPMLATRREVATELAFGK